MTQTPTLYGERYRPTIHFTPPRCWMNDPNGLVVVDGVYHLFYQHNPDDRVWSTMSWGHAVSRDLFHWQHRPLALRGSGEGDGFCFSGCAVIDERNSSGLAQDAGKTPIVLIYTQHSLYEEQVQSLAFSLDDGQSWRRYDANPVLQDKSQTHFRDPKVIWFAPAEYWVMVIAAGDRVKFYRSQNLLEWSYLSDFGQDHGAHGGLWECPDLIEFSDAGQSVWVLLISVDNGGPNGGSAMQYFVGEFDGARFAAMDSRVRWLDVGPDCYAGVSWFQPHVDVAPVMIAWMNNWQYAARLPTMPWRGAMTTPRELALRRDSSGCPEVVAKPARQLRDLYIQSRVIDRGRGWTGEAVSLRDSEAWNIDLVVTQVTHDRGALNLKFSFADRDVLLIASPETGTLSLDRCHVAAGLEDCEAFCAPASVPGRFAATRCLDLTIVIDRGSVEVFQRDGGCSLTALLFTDEPLSSLSCEELTKWYPGAALKATPLAPTMHRSLADKSPTDNESHGCG